MKACIYLWLLTATVVVQADNSDWHIFVPAEGTDLNGSYGDHNQAIIKGTAFTEFDFADYTPFEIPDQTAVSAFALEPISDSFVVWMSFSTPINLFKPADILRCDATECQRVFSVQADLNLASPVAIDALDVSEELILISFDVGFSYSGQYIDPKNVYGIGSDGIGGILLVEQVNGSDLGFSEVTNMTAYDKSPDDIDFAYFFGADTVYNRTDNTVFSNEILRINGLDPTQSEALAFSEEFQSMSAFYSLNSGFVGLFGESIDVNENAGNLEVELYRSNGNEAFVSVVVESMDATAIESVDYQFSPTTVQWFGGDDSNKSITIDIIDNQILDGEKVFFLYIFAASEFTSIFTIHELIEIRITDDEGSDVIFKHGFQ
ncbi:MAG: hypothetical protein DHS20C09_22570 [marine bacterium B5-7]|nr:MAG: hypothetical protein DHS20C09_22570 [marine bacterium B5-7]